MSISLTAPDWRRSSPQTFCSRVEELRQALVQIKTLRGIVPIRACCRKIRQPGQGEVYVRDHTEAGFSHGV
jgi:hypothetical protein